jgi:hypothetical protein
MANAAAAWPTWSALNTQLPAPAVWAAGCVTLGLACLLIHFISLAAEHKNGPRSDVDRAGPVRLDPAPHPAAV